MCAEALWHEYKIEKFNMQRAYGRLSFRQMLPQYLLANEELCPNIAKLCQITAVQTVHTVQCEGGFSRFNNIILNSNRTKLSDDHARDQMRVHCLAGPGGLEELQDHQGEACRELVKKAATRFNMNRRNKFHSLNRRAGWAYDNVLGMGGDPTDIEIGGGGGGGSARPTEAMSQASTDTAA